MMLWSSVALWDLSSPLFADENVPDVTQVQIKFTDEVKKNSGAPGVTAETGRATGKANMMQLKSVNRIV